MKPRKVLNRFGNAEKFFRWLLSRLWLLRFESFLLEKHKHSKTKKKTPGLQELVHLWQETFDFIKAVKTGGGHETSREFNIQFCDDDFSKVTEKRLS